MIKDKSLKILTTKYNSKYTKMVQARGALRGDAGWVSPRPLEMTHDHDSVRHQILDIIR